MAREKLSVAAMHEPAIEVTHPVAARPVPWLPVASDLAKQSYLVADNMPSELPSDTEFHTSPSRLGFVVQCMHVSARSSPSRGLLP